MHFEILVEDRSGKTMLDLLIPKIIGDQHTFRSLMLTRESAIFQKTSQVVPMRASAFCLTNFPNCSGDMEGRLPAILPTIRRW